MLAKENRIQLSAGGDVLTKTVTTGHAASIERTIYQTLRRIPRPSPLVFLMPDILELQATEAHDRTLMMNAIRGLTVNNLMGLLNRVIEHHPDPEVSEAARRIKHRLVAVVVADLAFFQSAPTQKSLEHELTNYAIPYDYRGKMSEAVNHIAQTYTCAELLKPGVIEEIHLVCEMLESAPSMFFRDSVLKNQIVLLPNFTDGELAQLSHLIAGADHRSVLNHCCRPAVADSFYSHLAALDASSLRVYNIDFQQAAERVASVDDWNQLLNAEVMGIDYEDGLDYATGQLQLPAATYHLSVVFRSLRALARRLYYRSNRPSLWSTRYAFESIRHHESLVLHALGYLNGSEVSLNLAQLRASLTTCRRSRVPLAWDGPR
jgi:hypothetical protein